MLAFVLWLIKDWIVTVQCKSFELKNGKYKHNNIFVFLLFYDWKYFKWWYQIRKII